MAKSQRYLVQKGSGHIYLWTQALAHKDDMEDLNAEIAEKRIEATKERLKKRKMAKFEPKPYEYPALLQEVASDIQAVEDKLTRLEEMEQKRLAEEEDLKRREAEGELPNNLVKEAPEKLEEDLRQERIDNDREIQMIRGMTSKGEVESYVLEHFGEDIDKRSTLATLKERAEDLRIDRMFEVEEEKKEE